jgi:hypothetical protein
MLEELRQASDAIDQLFKNNQAVQKYQTTVRKDEVD